MKTMSYPHLTNAPIVEGLIDLRIAPEVTDFAALGKFRDLVSEEYTEQRNQQLVQHVISSTAQPGPAIPARPVGYWLRAPATNRVLQAQVGGFSYSQLSPYDRWDTFRSAAKGLAQRYFEVVGERTITRTAVRYINRIEIPREHDLGRVLRTAPAISDALPQSLTGMFMRLVLPFEDANVIITEALDAATATSADKVSLILDIDVFREEAFSSSGDTVWECLERLRARKNEVFFGCLTDEARRTYE